VTFDGEEAFRRLGGPVYGYLRAAGATAAEDLLHDVFVDVFRGLDRFRGDDAALRRWVFTIAHHRLVDERRKTARRRRSPVEPATSVAPPTEPFDPALEDALGLLTPEQREVVVLRFVADLPLETVASMTGRSVGSVKAAQYRGLTQLRLALDPDLAPSSG
jgi:RNA polymerase sigma-70 factor (ECF subfamily)